MLVVCAPLSKDGWKSVNNYFVFVDNPAYQLW